MTLKESLESLKQQWQEYASVRLETWLEYVSAYEQNRPWTRLYAKYVSARNLEDVARVRYFRAAV